MYIHYCYDQADDAYDHKHGTADAVFISFCKVYKVTCYFLKRKLKKHK